MRKIFKALNFTSVILFLILSFVACDKDFSSLESDVLGEENNNFTTGSFMSSIVAYNKKLDSLQINNLPSTVLGVFNDPAFGQTTASIVTQISPMAFGPDFGDNAVLDSVILNIPYYSKAIIADSTYTISDSLYGSDPIKLSVYKNNYFLRDFDPNASTITQQNYYSKANGSINTTDNFAVTQNSIINFDSYRGELLKDTIFTPSNKKIVSVTFDDSGKKIRTKSAPALRLKLDSLFWANNIINKEGSPELSNENNFKNYFRGLYLKAEAVNGKGNLVFLNMASTDAKITLYYSRDGDVDGERTHDNYIFNFASTSSININRLNTFINNYNTIPLTNGNKILGDEKLYLKGTEGSMGVVDLFAGMVECDNEDGTTSLVTALECFKKTYRKLDGNGNYLPPVNGSYALKKLINEAHLIIYEDEGITIPSADYHKYDRIYAYDIENNSPTIDYTQDPISSTTDPFNSKYISLGQRIVTNGVAKYKIRITQHLMNILTSSTDLTNTKLGLVLSTNVNLTNNSKILNSNDVVTGVPSASIITPRGTILYGTNQNVPDNRKMKLEIFFTKPN
jgi:Domain of unknown function (DUF4270)